MGSDGLATKVTIDLRSSVGLTFDGKGNLYFTSEGENRIRVLSPDLMITTAVGNGTYNYSGDGELAANAQMGAPGQLVLDNDGALYVSDSQNPVVRKISKSGIVTPVAGNGTIGFSGDGGAAINAQLMS